MPHPRYPQLELTECGTCKGKDWIVVQRPTERVYRCERCLPRLKPGETLIERIRLDERAGETRRQAWQESKKGRSKR